jgi:hypothetical protein
MKRSAIIRIEGGIFSPDLLESLAHGDLQGQKPSDFGYKNETEMLNHLALPSTATHAPSISSSATPTSNCPKTRATPRSPANAGSSRCYACWSTSRPTIPKPTPSTNRATASRTAPTNRPNRPQSTSSGDANRSIGWTRRRSPAAPRTP